MLLAIEPEVALVGLRAMKMVALANTGFGDRELQLLAAVGSAVGVTVDPHALEPVTPAEIARVIPDELWRQRLLQAMVAMAMIDGDASADELHAIKTLSTALDVPDPWVRNLERVVDGDLLRLRIDIVRRMDFAQQLVQEMWDEKGMRGLWNLFNAARNDPALEPELAWRYKRLGLLPERTLGRMFWMHMTERKFAFPGEAGGFLEQLVHHDLIHVLTDYDTDPAGEAQVAAFNAGFRHEDHFAPIFMVLSMFQLGLPTLPVITPAKLALDPAAIIRAMARGAASRVDPTARDWDYWPLMELPIDDARAALGIAPA